jgi:hypothetical protein
MKPPLPSEPGYNTHFFASKIGWALQPGMNVVLEGEHDVRYFRLADRLYRQASGLRLLGDGIEVLAAGIGPKGGTVAIMEHFHQTFKNAKYDLRRDGEPVYRLATLLDDDRAGREAENFLVAKHTTCMLWRDVFRLQRCYPTDTRDLKQLDRRVREINRDWNGHHCEIEDLLPKALIDVFHEEHSNCYSRQPVERAGRWHFEFANGVKGALCTHAEQLAECQDLREVIEALKSLRFFLYVKPTEGSDIP